ncbi:MAG: hypothetical protein ACRC6A_07540 [Fusobacteriaceae bacterium]
MITKFLENNPEESFRIQDKNIKFTETKIIQLEDILEEKLVSKKWKKLVGGALISRLEKIARDENVCIEYNGKIIKKLDL